MKILIDILHPAHVHFFRPFRQEIIDRGHEILVTAREKDVTIELLEAYAIPHTVLSQQRTGRAGLAYELATRTARLIRIARRFRPDVMTGVMGPSIALAGKMLRIPRVVFYDTEIATSTNRWVYPMSSAVCTPDSYAGDVRGNHVTYPSYQEMAYLHPNQFEPDLGKLETFGLTPPYSLLRFVSWEASHDVGATGLTLGDKLRLVNALRVQGEVAVSSEGALPEELEPYRLTGPVADVHHVLAGADLFVGESGTMSTEAAVLGTPAIFVADRSAGVFDDNERRYGLLQGCLRRIQPRWCSGPSRRSTTKPHRSRENGWSRTKSTSLRGSWTTSKRAVGHDESPDRCNPSGPRALLSRSRCRIAIARPPGRLHSADPRSHTPLGRSRSGRSSNSNTAS